MREAAGGAMTGPVLKWPGSKWRLAPWIVGHFPAHRSYLEPYAGSLAVLFRKLRAPLETVNDLDGRLVRFYRTLRERPEDVAAAAALTPWARQEWEGSFEVADDPLEDARRFLVRSHQSHGYRPRYRAGWRHATGRGVPASGARDVAGQWVGLPPLLLAAAERLCGVQIECRPALELIERFGHADCLIYADPPYMREVRGDWLYEVEMGDDDHTALLAALDAHPGPVALSGYRCPRYDERLGAWQRMERATTAEKGGARTEALWLNPVAVAALGRERQAVLDFGSAAEG